MEKSMCIREIFGTGQLNETCIAPPDLLHKFLPLVDRGRESLKEDLQGWSPCPLQVSRGFQTAPFACPQLLQDTCLLWPTPKGVQAANAASNPPQVRPCLFYAYGSDAVCARCALPCILPSPPLQFVQSVQLSKFRGKHLAFGTHQPKLNYHPGCLNALLKLKA